VGGREELEAAGDVAVSIQAFPKVRFLLQLWEGDDEFAADGNVLMRPGISAYLSTEDIALAAGLPIYKMMALARG
jgi:hypothetical protein